MGIKDLLRNLEGATLQKNISDFSGKRLAIDASGWLHKAVFATAEDWVDSNFTDSQLYVDFVLTRVRNLQSCGIMPVMVFDGKRNNLKSETRAKRDEGRINNIENAKRLLESISKTSDPVCRSKMRNECISCFQRGLGVTHEMEKNCLAALRKYNVDIIVAPYEADPQLAYLCHINYCDGVMTEDSDILVYSAVCGKPFPILYKFDKSGTVQITDLKLCGVFAEPGNEASSASSTSLRSSAGPTGEESSNDLESAYYGIGVAAEKAALATVAPAGKGSKRKIADVNGAVGEGSTKGSGGSFLSQLQAHFKPPSGSEGCHLQGRRMFVHLCLLAGCDYSESIPGVGLQTALQVVVRFKDTANNARLKKICDYFKLTNKRVADSYLPRILRAEQLFFYHPVYNPYTESVAYFTPPEMNGDISGTLSGPSVTAMELLKLGVEHAEVLSLPSRKDGSSSCNTSMSSDDSSVTDGFAMTIRDVCKGAYSIKDHQEIVPRYPWELDGGRRSGNSSGWYMRRTLVNALGKPTLNNSSSFNRAHTYSGGSYNTNKPIESTPSSSGRSSSGASLGMNAISSFMLGNNSTSRQPGRSTICSTHQAPSLNRATEPALASGSAGSALVTSAGAGQQQQGLVAGKTASGYFLQSKLSQQHTVTAQPPQQPQHQVQQARTGGSANSQGYSHSRSHLFDSFDLLTATTTASSTVSSAASTSRSGSSASLAFTAAATSSSLVEEAHTVYDLCEEDSALDDMASSPQRASTSGAHSSAQPVQTEEAAEAVMSVYDVSDSPMVVRAPVGASPLGVSVGAGGEALRSVMLMEDCVVVDLTAASPVQSRKQPRCDLQSFRYKTSAGADDGGCGSGGTGTGVATSPSKLQMLLLSPDTDSQQAQQQPTATTKKFQRLNPEEAKSPDFSHSLEAYALGSESSPSVRQQGAKSGALTHSSVSSSGINSKSILGGGASHNQQQSGVRRKTLGAAPFVPMHIPRAPPTSAASMNTDLAGVVSGGLSGEKRKHNVAAVPVPRKKVTKAQTSGTIMVASIKSFFSAV